MRTRTPLILGSLLSAVLLAWSPAPAAGYTHAFGAARGVQLGLASGLSSAALFAVAEGAGTNLSDLAEAGVERTFACVWIDSLVPVGRSREMRLLDDFGCGSLTVSVDPLLSEGTVTGVIRSEVRDIASGRFISTSWISVDITLTGGDPPQAASVQQVAPAGRYAGVAAVVSLAREATSSGSITSASLGSVSEGQYDGGMFEAAGGYVAVYR